MIQHFFLPLDIANRNTVLCSSKTSRLFPVAPFIIALSWKQPKCPLKEWINCGILINEILYNNKNKQNVTVHINISESYNIIIL